jgi:ABC-type polysaccharide/polyol phosphate export permease
MSSQAVLWKEYKVFTATILSTALSAVVGPALYLIAFGWGIGSDYRNFIVPAIIAMNSMSIAFGTTGNDINLSRIYMGTFEAVMQSPIHMAVYTITKVFANVLKTLFSIVLITLICALFGSNLNLSLTSVLLIFLNTIVFAIFGFLAGILINTHSGMAKISNFVITPMSFLSGTFFELNQFPPFLAAALKFLPLTQTVSGLRDPAASGTAILVLLAYVIIFLPITIKCCEKAV